MLSSTVILPDLQQETHTISYCIHTAEHNYNTVGNYVQQLHIRISTLISNSIECITYTHNYSNHFYVNMHARINYVRILHMYVHTTGKGHRGLPGLSKSLLDLRESDKMLETSESAGLNGPTS